MFKRLIPGTINLLRISFQHLNNHEYPGISKKVSVKMMFFLPILLLSVNFVVRKMKKTKFHFLVYLGFLSIIGFLSTDMYLPAFDKMRIDFGTTKTVISASLSLFLGGFAIAQLIWGPVSDKYGKPKAVIWGLILFMISSLTIFFTHNAILMLVLRVVQAIGACAATVSWQALVIDEYPSGETKKIFASIMPLVALSPALAPLLGAYIIHISEWRYIFIILAAIALALIAYTATLKKGSGNQKSETDQHPDNKSYQSFFKSKKYLGNVIIYAFCSAGFFAWLTGAPFFLKELGYNENEIGLSFVPQTIAFMIGGYGYRYLSDKWNARKLMPYLLAGYSVSMIALLMVAIFTHPTLTTLLIPFCTMALSNGAIYPIAVNDALSTFPNHSGKASALQNTLQLSACFAASSAVSIFSTNVLLTTSIVMAATIFFVYFGYRITREKYQKHPISQII